VSPGAILLLLLSGRNHNLIRLSGLALTRSRITDLDMEPISGLYDVTSTRSSVTDVESEG
jgi:hypothetical protein